MTQPKLRLGMRINRPRLRSRTSWKVRAWWKPRLSFVVSLAWCEVILCLLWRWSSFIFVCLVDFDLWAQQCMQMHSQMSTVPWQHIERHHIILIDLNSRFSRARWRSIEKETRTFLRSVFLTQLFDGYNCMTVPHAPPASQKQSKTGRESTFLPAQ